MEYWQKTQMKAEKRLRAALDKPLPQDMRPVTRQEYVLGESQPRLRLVKDED